MASAPCLVRGSKSLGTSWVTGASSALRGATLGEPLIDSFRVSWSPGSRAPTGSLEFPAAHPIPGEGGERC